MAKSIHVAVITRDPVVYLTADRESEDPITLKVEGAQVEPFGRRTFKITPDRGSWWDVPSLISAVAPEIARLFGSNAEAVYVTVDDGQMQELPTH